MNEYTTAKTSSIDLLSIILLGLCGPIWAVVFAHYAILYWLKNKSKSFKLWYFILIPTVLSFAFVNTFNNWFVCTLLFRELPKEFFTTTRCQRWKNSNDDSKRELADLIGGFLDSRDPGHY
jgi:hypothetical protein